MNNTQLNPGLSAMLEGTNLSIDPGALLQQQPLVETDTASSRTASTASLPRLSTPDTDTDDFDQDDQEEEEEPPKKRSTRNSKTNTTKMPKSKTTTSPAKSKRGGAGTTGTADKRRKRNLERNRAAASKCRQRKKQWQDGLEYKKTELESRYKSLHHETKELTEEVAQLKNFVMAHAGCNDANIDDWIRNEADSFVRRMSTSQMHPAAAAAAAQHYSAATAALPVSAPTSSMPQMQSPAQGNLTSTPPMNDALNNMFAPSGSKAPFDNNGNAINDLRTRSPQDKANQNNPNIFNQDLLMV